MRTMSISGTVVTILTWLLRIGEERPASDILIITGVKKNLVRAFFSLGLVLSICCLILELRYFLCHRIKDEGAGCFFFTLFFLRLAGLKVTC